MPDSVSTSARPVTPTTILAAELGDIAGQLSEMAGIEPELLARVRRARDLAAGLDPYLDTCSSPESPALAELARRTREADWGNGPLEQEMLSGHVEGQTLKFLVHMTKATRVLEIGMFTGYSALAMAEALPTGGSVTACELDDGVADFARRCFAESEAGRSITVEVGPALDTLKRLTGPFDLVFVDADKPGYLEYFRYLMDSDLLAPDAVVAVDNTLMQGQPWATGPRSANGDAIAEFNRAVADDPRVEQVTLPLRDGVTLIRRVDSTC
jgi:caffeoyl-CoA O-methyltransferase